MKPKRQTPTRSQLIKKADKYFSLAVRYRDSRKRGGEWYAHCITCDKYLPMKQLHAGHFMSRRYMSTRYEDENVNAQCAGCNTFRAGEQYKYSKALELKYGDGTAERLHREAQKVKKITTQELLEIIEESKEAIRFYEGK